MRIKKYTLIHRFNQAGSSEIEGTISSQQCENKFGKSIRYDSLKVKKGFASKNRLITKHDFLDSSLQHMSVYTSTGDKIHQTMAPMIDGLSFEDSSRSCFEIGLFIQILNHPTLYKTRLIKHFAACQQQNKLLTDPQDSNSVLIKSIKQDFPIAGSTERRKKVVYYINGGSHAFDRIYKLDPFFFSTINAAKDVSDAAQKPEDFCVDWSRLHLCAKSSKNLMPFVTQSVKKGHIYYKNSALSGIGSFKGKSFQGPVGRQSKSFKSLKNEENKFELSSLYAGDENTKISCIIYDKAKQKEEDYTNETPCAGLDIKTHLEIRLNCKKLNYSSDFYKSLFLHYFSDCGTNFRTQFVLDYFCNNFVVVNKQRINPQTSDFHGSVAPWWFHFVIEPLQELNVLALTRLERNIKKNTLSESDIKHPSFKEYSKILKLNFKNWLDLFPKYTFKDVKTASEYLYYKRQTIQNVLDSLSQKQAIIYFTGLFKFFEGRSEYCIQYI